MTIRTNRDRLIRAARGLGAAGGIVAVAFGSGWWLLVALLVKDYRSEGPGRPFSNPEWWRIGQFAIAILGIACLIGGLTVIGSKAGTRRRTWGVRLLAAGGASLVTWLILLAGRP